MSDDLPVAYSTGEDGGRPMVTGGWTAVDDRRVVPALGGLIDGTGMWWPGALACIARTGRFLTGTWDPQGAEGQGEGQGEGESEDGPGGAGEGAWLRFIGRIGAVALRASVASTRPERRERLLAPLEMWAESPLPLPGRTLPEPFAHAWALVEKGEGPV